MQKTFPTISVTQDLANEVVAAGRLLDNTLPPDAHHTLSHEAFATRRKDGSKDLGQRWSCTILDGWAKDLPIDLPAFLQCRRTTSPMTAVSLCLDAWRQWRDAVESKRLAAEAVRQQQFDADNVPDRFDNAQ